MLGKFSSGKHKNQKYYIRIGVANGEIAILNSEKIHSAITAGDVFGEAKLT